VPLTLLYNEAVTELFLLLVLVLVLVLVIENRKSRTRTRRTYGGLESDFSDPTLARTGDILVIVTQIISA